jgi:hypothetical protein
VTHWKSGERVTHRGGRVTESDAWEVGGCCEVRTLGSGWVVLL